MMTGKERDEEGDGDREQWDKIYAYIQERAGGGRKTECESQGRAGVGREADRVEVGDGAGVGHVAGERAELRKRVKVSERASGREGGG
jgi:hypothetical protein